MGHRANLLGAAAACLLAGLDSAYATGNFLCEADDGQVQFSAESTFSHGLGEVFMGFGATLKILMKDVPADLAAVAFEPAHLAHHWFADGDLNLHMYREREGDVPHGYVELIVKTEQNAQGDDETAFAGTYELTVYDVGAPSDGEGRTLRAEGKVSCSVG